MPLREVKDIYQGNAKTYSLTVRQDGSLLDWGVYTPYLCARRTLEGTTNMFLAAGSTTGLGTCTIPLTRADTMETVEGGVLELVNVDGSSNWTTLDQWTLNIKPVLYRGE